MHLSRPLFLPLLIALCIAPLAAQSLTKEPALPANAQATEDFFQFLQPFDVRGITLRPAVPAAEGKDDSQDMRSKDLVRQRILTLQENESTCYKLRTYRVARESPDSDSTRPAGYSTCQPSTRFQMKTAVDTREIAPR